MSDDRNQPNAGSAAVTVDKDMSISHQEFFRVLPGALKTGEFRREGDTVVAEEGDGRRLEIELSAEERRDVPDLSLPRTRIRLIFHGYTESERADRLALFERSYQRGGG